MLVLDQKFLQKEMILYLTGTKNYSCTGGEQMQIFT